MNAMAYRVHPTIGIQMTQVMELDRNSISEDRAIYGMPVSPYFDVDLSAFLEMWESSGMDCLDFTSEWRELLVEETTFRVDEHILMDVFCEVERSPVTPTWSAIRFCREHCVKEEPTLLLQAVEIDGEMALDAGIVIVHEMVPISRDIDDMVPVVTVASVQTIMMHHGYEQSSWN